jgi:hypothetical protein
MKIPRDVSGLRHEYDRIGIVRVWLTIEDDQTASGKRRVSGLLAERLGLLPVQNGIGLEELD